MKTTTTFFVGDVVWVTDQWHQRRGRNRRPNMINDIQDGMIQVVPLTHRPQGQWTTNELGGGTYLAPVHFRTGEANLTWVQPQQCELYAKQLRDETITEALREVDRLVA